MLDQPKNTKMDFPMHHLGFGHFLVIGSSDRLNVSFFDILHGKFKQVDKFEQGQKV